MRDYENEEGREEVEVVESRGERETVRKKKMMYRNLLDTSTEDAKRHCNEAKVEARRRRAKNSV